MHDENRLMLKNGFAPVQRVLGYMPRLPGGLLTGDEGNEAFPSQVVLGERGTLRSMQIRKAAAKAFMEADCEDALRRAISAGPRMVSDFDVGEVVYFYRMGADKKLKFNARYWQGPGRIVMIDQPSTIWIAFQGSLVKASPERVRRASPEENLTLSGWIDDLLATKADLEKEPKRGYIDLSAEPIPDELRREGGDDDYQPASDDELGHDMATQGVPRTDPAPTHRYHVKAPPPLPLDEAVGESDEPDVLDQAMEEIAGERSEQKRELEEGTDEQPVKRSRLQYLELYYAKVENLTQARARKEVRFNELSKVNQACFRRAIDKEIQNNISIGAYKPMSLEESARARQQEPSKIMDSRYVLTAKPLEPQDVEDVRKAQLLLEWDSQEPCKAKARHVMKGFSEEGAENLEAATPQVTREATLVTAQLVASHRWELGFMDFTQAFHSGDLIERTIYAEQPREGVPGMQPGQLIRLLKTCYGLSDGPLAWYKHLRRVLVETLKYRQSLADPCIFFKHRADGALSGVIAVATDDLLHGGDEEHLKGMRYLQSTYKLGKFQFGSGRFCGKNFNVQPDGSILVNQDHYTKEKLVVIELSRARKKQRFSYCNASEISQLRMSVGALAWLSKETRPDIAGRVALLQQSFPQPRVRDLIEANAITKEAMSTPESGIRIMPIPPANLRVGVATDASWGNARDQKTEAKSEDYWEQTSSHWIRHHTTPRRTAFHPGMVDGPDLHSIEAGRQTYLADNSRPVEDTWTSSTALRTISEEPWTGTTWFRKLPPGQTLGHEGLSESFLQMMSCSIAREAS